MELFSEIYGNYYRAVEKVLQKTGDGPLSIDEIKSIIADNAFNDSSFYITPKLTGRDWPFLKKTDDGYITDIRLPEDKSITILQKSWLRAILSDPKIGLFLEDKEIAALDSYLSSIPPLYASHDFYVYDSAEDGDDYSDPGYRCNFRVLLHAINTHEPVFIKYEGRRGNMIEDHFMPHKMEYSVKNDKFRVLCCRAAKHGLNEYVLNLSRIQGVEPADTDSEATPGMDKAEAGKTKFHTVKFEITEERNALERVLVQFANYEKSTVYDEAENKYTCTMKYNSLDETEILIMLLSFGPTIKIIGPERFLSQFKDRIKKQMELST